MSEIPRIAQIARISRIVVLAPFTRYRRLTATAASVAIGLGAMAAASALHHSPSQRWRVKIAAGDYASRATRAVNLLERRFYNGTGLWHMCFKLSCNTKNRDWGSDSLTYVLYFRWMLTRDRSVPPIMRTLASTAHAWVPSDKGSSDTVMWDAIAEAREYQVTRSAAALAKSEQAFRWVDSVMAHGFATGACPDIDYQWPRGGDTGLKTLETATNYIKAALLLHEITGSAAYLAKAEWEYQQVRRYFLIGSAALYTVYVFDDGSTCRPLPGRYFASVNGNMIWAGSALAADTGDRAYLAQAVATAQAVRADLADGAGVYADLQADNDVSEPLIEAMYRLASHNHQRFAAGWLLASASAAGADQNAAGAFGRFFDGPPPTGPATAWQVNGGAALMQAAAALDPRASPADPDFWRRAGFVADARGLAGSDLRINVSGRAIAIIGTIGAVCCESGHARVFVDGVETFDRTGIWQNMTSPSVRQPGQVLFAWRWPESGRHTITIKPGIPDAEEGGSFFSMDGYLLVR